MKKYKISTIIPVYNVDKYLEETILSIVNQTMGFENIQMILVNDGSTDNSEEICLKYKTMYPDNIIYISKENGGVSSARNIGIEHASGQYIHFMDSDDLISSTAYEVGYKMLIENNLGIVCFRIKMFDAEDGMHNLDYRFLDGDKIVDLTDEYYYPLYHIPTALIKNTLINNLKFDSKLKVSEDLKFMSEVVSIAKKIGVIASEMYFYRRRNDNSSAIQTSNKNYSFFFDTPLLAYKYVLDLRDKYKSMHNYLTNIIVCDLKWRIFWCDLKTLNLQEKKKYKKLIYDILLECDDEIICNQKPFNLSVIFGELYYKYGKHFFDNIIIKNNKLIFNDIIICSVDELYIQIYNMNVNKDILEIDALFDFAYNHIFDLFLKVNGKFIKFDKKNIEEKEHDLYMIDSKNYSIFYSANLKMINNSEIEFYISINNTKIKIKPIFSRYSKLNKLKNSYYKKSGYILTHKDNKILINRKSNFNCFKYLLEVLLKKKDIMLFGMLCLYYITYPFVKHDNWIISDRFDVGGDNGEHFFRYIRKNVKKKNVYFALSKDSKDIKRIEKYGKVIKFNTLSFYLKYLNSESVISSHLDDYIYKPFRRRQIFLNNILDRKYVFLQHGITQQNLSGWLSKYNNKIDLFICSAENEYKSILIPDYMYNKDVVKLTGFCRYDNLLKNDIKEENIIALMPTWRTNLVGDVIVGTQNRGFNSSFKESNYFKFYNSLINDKRLQKFLKKHDFKILFCVHPSLKGQYNDFEGNEYTKMVLYPEYQEVFKKSKFMITDYSSVFFDFAYLKKPILYTQFDSDDLMSNHGIYKDKGYFEYERDGFGDVVYNLDDAVDKINSIIENGCKMEDKYKKRVDKFFKYKDDKNCERVYNCIVDMLKK